MKKKHLMLLMIINVALTLLYVGILWYDNYYELPIRYWTKMYIRIGIRGSIVNIIALLAMWFRGTSIKKVVRVISIIIAICIACFILSLPTYSFLYLAPMLAIFVFIYSIIFFAFVWCLYLCFERKDYSYIGFLIVPTIGILIFVFNFL